MLYRQVCAWPVGFVLAMHTAFPQGGASALTPEQLVQAALTRNRDFLAVQQRIAEAQGLLRQAGVRPVPTVEIEGASGRPLGTRGEEEFTAGYFYTVETGGKRGKRLSVAEKSLALAKAELAERTREIAFEVKTRYAEAIAGRRKLDALERLLKTNREYYTLTRARVNEGDAAPLDAQILETDLNRARAQQAVATGKSRGALLELRTLVSLPANEPLNIGEALPAPAIPNSLSQLQTLAIANRPDLQTLRLLEQQSGSEMVLAQAEAKPNFTLSGRYSYRTSAFDQFGLTLSGSIVPLQDRANILTFGLSVPLNTARRNQGNIEAAVARQAGARLRREYLESIIPTQVEAAFERWQAAKRALDIFSAGVVEQSERNLGIMRQAYSLGQLRLLDVLNEQRRLIDTELAYIDAQAEQYRAFAALEQSTGGALQ